MSVKIAVAGATGDLGVPIVKTLLAEGHFVTALSRTGSRNTVKLPKHRNLSVAEVDYDSVQSLTNSLKGHTVVVSTLTSLSVDNQGPLIDASVAAGVARFIPSEFGSDVLNTERNKLPVFEGKVKTHEYLKAVADSNPDFSFTIICNGSFLDWAFDGFLVNLRKHTAIVYDGGDIPVTATNLSTIGKAIDGIIRNLDATANRPVYIQDAVITQNALIRYAREKDGVDWKITHKSTMKMHADSTEELSKGNNGWPVLQQFVFCAVFGTQYGSNFVDHLDNELLGIKGLTDDEVRKLVESFM